MDQRRVIRRYRLSLFGVCCDGDAERAIGRGLLFSDLGLLSRLLFCVLCDRELYRPEVSLRWLVIRVGLLRR